MKTLFLLLMTWLFVPLFDNSENIHEKVCGQYDVHVHIYDVHGNDTSLSHSWNPGFNGSDDGLEFPDSILISVTIGSTIFDFINNLPYDIFVDVDFKLKGSYTWDCMNPENPLYSKSMVLFKNTSLKSSDFFSNAEPNLENLHPITIEKRVNVLEFYLSTINQYDEVGEIFILNALIINVNVRDASDLHNTCSVEYYHPICLESTKTIFDSNN